MRLSRREAPSGQRATGGPAGASVDAEVQVLDHLEPRVRIPADLLRCIFDLAGIALLVLVALRAQATASGVETDVIQASDHLLKGLLQALAFVAAVALFVLPVALAIRLIVIGQVQRLAEAIGTGVAAAVVAVVANWLVRRHATMSLFRTLTRTGRHSGAVAAACSLHHLPSPACLGHSVPFDPYLAGLSAFLTMIGLSGRPRWRAGFWLAIGFYVITSLATPDSPTTVLSLPITLLIGAVIGSGFRYAFGVTSERPSGLQIAAAISAVDLPVAEIRRTSDIGTGNRRYIATSSTGERRDVTVFDRDQQAADFIYRVYRALRLTAQATRTAPLTVHRAVERLALLNYAVRDAGVHTPRLRALVGVGPEAAVLATDHVQGTTLADLPEPTDEQLRGIWDTVLKLHRRRVTHRALTADRLLLSGPDGTRVTLLEPGHGDVAASDLQLRLDLAQLLAETALQVGPDKAADIAMERVPAVDLADVAPLLQPVVLARSTRNRLRRHKEVLTELRKRLLDTVPEGDVPPVQLERFRLRSVLTLVVGVFAAYILVGEFTKVKFGHVIKSADWRWTILALGLSAVTYVGAAWQLSGFVLEKLHLVRTFLAQLAGSFVTLVTPAAVGGVALNLRYLRKADVPATSAAASIGVSQVLAFALHLLLLVIFAALTGVSQPHSLPLPSWVYITVGALAAIVLVALAFPAARRLAQKRLVPAINQILPRLLDLAQRPAKLAEGIGGALLLTAAYILCLMACVRALGVSLPLASVAVAYLAGSAVGSLVPTPGGIGGVEATLTGLLTAAGMAGGTALSAVLLFRLITFWLPVPVGWAAMSYLQRKDAL